MLQLNDHRTDRQARPHRAVAAACLLAVVALFSAACGNDTDDAAGSDTTETRIEDATASGEEEVEFTSPGEEYSVTFPAEPTAQPTPMQLPGGKTIEMPLQVVSTRSSQYTAATVTYPDDVPVSDDPDGMLDGAVDGAVDSVPGAEIDNIETIEVDGLPGRRVEFSVTQDDAEGRGEAVFVIDGQSMFHAIALGETDDADAHGRFLDSFDVL